jgi:hypothetical protein
VCVGVPHTIVLPLHNQTDGWELGEVKLTGEQENPDFQCAVVRTPSMRVLMGPNKHEELEVEEN